MAIEDNKQDEREEIFKLYRDSYEKLSDAIETIVNEKITLPVIPTEKLPALKEFAMRNEYSLKVLKKWADLITEPPSAGDESRNIAKVVDSAELIKDYSISLKKSLNSKGKSRWMPRESIIQAVIESLNKAEEGANKIAKDRLKELKPAEASSELVDYYNALEDVEISSRQLIQLANTIKDDNFSKKQSNTKSSAFLQKIKDLWEIITNKVGNVINSLKGPTAVAGSILLVLLKNWKNPLRRE